jgi:hypothetical protein
LQHSWFNMSYPNHALHLTNSHHKNIGFFTWISFEFGGKIAIWKISIVHAFQHWHLAPNWFLRWIKHRIVHCSIGYHTLRCICKLAITPSFH